MAAHHTHLLIVTRASGLRRLLERVCAGMAPPESFEVTALGVEHLAEFERPHDVTHIIMDDVMHDHLRASAHKYERPEQSAIMVIGDDMSETLWRDLRDGTVHVFLHKLFAPDTLTHILSTWIVDSTTPRPTQDKKTNMVLDTMTTLMFSNMALLDVTRVSVPRHEVTSPWLCSSVHYQGERQAGMITLRASRALLAHLTEYMTGSPPFQSNSCELLLNELASELGNMFIEHEAKETSWSLALPILTAHAPQSPPPHTLCYELGQLDGHFYVEHVHTQQHARALHDVA